MTEPDYPLTIGEDQIASLIPHRHPFLFVKSAIVSSARCITGVCQWGIDHPVFVGHFPQFPLVPGVLIIEAAAQVAGLLLSINMRPEGSGTWTSAPDTRHSNDVSEC